MANEITALDGDGANRFRLLLLFPIAAPVEVGGSNVVQQPSAELPPLALAAIDGAEVTAIDDGTLGWRIIDFVKPPTLTNPQLIVEAQRIHAAQKLDHDAIYAQKYRHAGQRFNAT